MLYLCKDVFSKENVGFQKLVPQEADFMQTKIIPI